MSVLEGSVLDTLMEYHAVHWGVKWGWKLAHEHGSLSHGNRRKRSTGERRRGAYDQAMTIRPMHAGDIDRVAILVTQLGYPATPLEISRRFERIDGRDHHILLVADAGQEAHGWIHVAAHPSLECDASAEILGLVVADDQRGQGIGAALVTAAESWAAAYGCGILRVRSRIARERAHTFYERNGFERIKTQHCFQKTIA